MKSTFLQELAWRGLLQEHTPEADAFLAEGPALGYIGFDPTADSLHLGSLATAMLLVHFQRCGHRPVVLIGGATAMIGDPSGKREERQLLDEEQIRHNQACLEAQLRAYLDFSPGPLQPLIVNNFDWFGQMGWLEFLRDVGKHLSVNYMMAKDSVQSRMDTGLSFTEFSYQLMQGYDFLHLARQHNCRVQLGGSDQWGNITAGTELCRRMLGLGVHGVTGPLLLKSDGSKMGKSEQGNLWLDPGRTSPYRFYQYLLNVADEDVAAMLKRFSLKSRPEIEGLLAEQEANPGRRAGQKALAEELTTRVHGAEALQHAQEASAILFGNASVDQLKRLSPELLLEVFEGVPQAELPQSRLQQGLTLIDLLVESQACQSKGEARRALKGGGVRLNKQKIDDESRPIQLDDLLNGRYLLLQTGKKAYHLVTLTD